MGHTIFKNQGSIDNFHTLLRHHFYSDAFGDIVVIVNIKSLTTTIMSETSELTGHIDELIHRPDLYDKEPDGRFIFFLHRIKIAAQYDYLLNRKNWDVFYNKMKP